MEVLALRGDFPKSGATLARVVNREAYPLGIWGESQVERDTLRLSKLPGLSAIGIAEIKMASVGVQDVLTVGRPSGSVCEDLLDTPRRAGRHGHNPDRRLSLGTFRRTSDQ